MDFDKPGSIRKRVVKATARTDMASQEQVKRTRKEIYEQAKKLAGGDIMPQDFWDLYYGILLTLADHGSSKRLSAHPDVVVELGKPDSDVSSTEGEGAESSTAAGKKQEKVGQFVVGKTITYQMAKLSEATLRADIKSVRRFARAEANQIQKLIMERGFIQQSQWHIKSKMPEDMWLWAFDVADYVTDRTPDEREKLAISSARKNIRATEEIINYATGDTFRSGTA
jgi:hypothetical protein